MDITELTNLPRAVTWLPWAVQYFFLVGISVGCFLLSLPGFLAPDGPSRARLARLALLGALAAGLAAPVALVSDLHQPARFWHFYAYFQPGSWMAWGAWLLPLYVGGLALYGWLALRADLAVPQGTGLLAGTGRALGAGRPASRRALGAAAAVALAGAAGVALYSGMEMMSVRARPLWNTPLLPLQLFATGLAGAIGLVLVANRVLGERDAKLEAGLNRGLALAECVVLLLGVAWLVLGASGWSPVHSQALAQVAPMREWQVTAVWALAATVLPILLALKWPERSGLLTGLIALHAAWMMRWTVFIGAQSLPKVGAAQLDYQLPLGHDGLLGMAGSAALFVLIAWLLIHLDPRLAQTSARRAS